jgi:hypothetical protein
MKTELKARKAPLFLFPFLDHRRLGAQALLPVDSRGDEPGELRPDTRYGSTAGARGALREAHGYSA